MDERDREHPCRLQYGNAYSIQLSLVRQTVTNGFKHIVNDFVKISWAPGSVSRRTINIRPMLTPATMTTQLNAANLNLLDPKIQVPKYDRQKVGQSIMHVGLGGFHRAHQALYMDDLLHQGGDSQWGYCGVGLLKHDARMRDVMLSQDCLYTLVERSLEGDKARVVGSIVHFLFAPDDPQKVIEQMASPQTLIVSLTITEGGYYIDQSTGHLDEKHPDIQYDLAHPH